jgi:putative ABC transport system permease protein
LQQVVNRVFPDAVVFGVASMQAMVDQSTASRRFQLLVLGYFGILALLLATIGVGGVLLLSVRERRGALAVRMALGASRRRLWWQVQRDGLSLVTIGISLGATVALAGARLFSSVVYGVSVRDPVAFVVAPLLMLVAAFIASAIPAARALAVNPASALRE